jgi:hypothetical protein
LKNAYTLLTLFGVIVLGVFAYISYQYLFLPYFGISWPSTSAVASLALILGVWIAGAIAYPAAKWYFKTQGLDFSMVFKELPPE